MESRKGLSRACSVGNDHLSRRMSSIIRVHVLCHVVCGLGSAHSASLAFLLCETGLFIYLLKRSDVGKEGNYASNSRTSSSSRSCVV